MGIAEGCRGTASRRGVGWVGRYAQVNGEAIHYVEKGQGAPVLLIHGFIAWSYTWRKTLPALACHFHTYAVDLRGFGLSQRGAGLRYGLDDQADMLAAFMDHCGIPRAVLVGHSMGGEVALRFALRHPDRAGGLVLVAPSALVRRRRLWAERYLLSVPVLGPLAVRLAVLNRRFAARTLRAAYFRPETASPGDVEGYLLPAAIRGSARSFVAMLHQLDLGAAADRLADIHHRTLLIWGENDPWLPVEHGRRLARILPDCRFVTFPECGHVPPEEHPERFNDLVIRFITSL